MIYTKHFIYNLLKLLAKPKPKHPPPPLNYELNKKSGEIAPPKLFNKSPKKYNYDYP
jgi:hypothetical protein